MAGKRKISVASMLFYTFGTILLLTLIIICILNFIRDGRPFR
ncbi:MAG TPA: hypothetical protein PK423_05585 [Clostridiales bacterium]|jgi:hypothetical protein|nr:hypothetical protein [Clostridiales bacterium]HPZ05489.1 hypothetical protein [Clostridiales bacterium]HQD31817.1 hypothetical protein [Clostridiales bacterium]